MVQERTIAWEEGCCHFERLCVPELWLFLFGLNVKWSELADFVFELDDEADFSWDAKVTNNQEADCFKERVSIQLLLVPSDADQVLKLNVGDLHYVADIERSHPLRLIQKSQDMS